MTERQSNYDIPYVVVDVFRHEMVKFIKFWPFKMFRVSIGVVLKWSKSKIYWATYITRSEFARWTNLHNRLSALKSPRRRKWISTRYFYIFLLPNTFIRRNQAEFSMVLSGLKQYQPRKSTLDQFRRVWRVFLNKLWRTSEWTNIKVEMIFIRLKYHKI